VFPAGEFWLDAQSVETEVPSAQAPTRACVDVFSLDFSIVAKSKVHFLVK